MRGEVTILFYRLRDDIIRERLYVRSVYTTQPEIVDTP